MIGLLHVWICMPQPHRGNGPFLELQIFRAWVIIRLLHLQVKFPAASQIAVHTLPYQSGVWVSAALLLLCQEGNTTAGNTTALPCAGCSANPSAGEPSVLARPTTEHCVHDGLLREGYQQWPCSAFLFPGKLVLGSQECTL